MLYFRELVNIDLLLFVLSVSFNFVALMAAYLYGCHVTGGTRGRAGDAGAMRKPGKAAERWLAEAGGRV